MFRMALSMKAGNHNDAGFLHKKIYPVGEPAHSGPSASFFHDRKLQGCNRNCFHGIGYCLGESLTELRPNAFVSRLRLLKLRIRLREPENAQCHCFLNRPALTCSQGITSEGLF